MRWTEQSKNINETRRRHVRKIWTCTRINEHRMRWTQQSNTSTKHEGSPCTKSMNIHENQWTSNAVDTTIKKHQRRTKEAVRKIYEHSRESLTIEWGGHNNQKTSTKHEGGPCEYEHSRESKKIEWGGHNNQTTSTKHEKGPCEDSMNTHANQWKSNEVDTTINKHQRNTKDARAQDSMNIHENQWTSNEVDTTRKNFNETRRRPVQWIYEHSRESMKKSNEADTTIKNHQRNTKEVRAKNLWTFTRIDENLMRWTHQSKKHQRNTKEARAKHPWTFTRINENRKRWTQQSNNINETRRRPVRKSTNTHE